MSKHSKNILKNFFLQSSPEIDLSHKARQKDLVMRAYETQMHRQNLVFWKRFSWIGVLGAIMIVPALNIDTMISPSQAGKLNPIRGEVALIRDGKLIPLSGEENLLVGDIVEIGENSFATVSMSGEVLSQIDSDSRIVVDKNQEIFLEEGNLSLSTNDKDATIKTVRGNIDSQAGGSVEVSVLGNGETTITPKINEVSISFDKQTKTQKNFAAGPGQEITLKSDSIKTKTSEKLDITELSSAEIKRAESRLIIARTKLLTFLINPQEGDFEGAQSSFKSILLVQQSAQGTEHDLSNVSMQDVTSQISQFLSEDSQKDLEALAVAFELIEESQNNLNTTRSLSYVDSFDRFMAIERLFEDEQLEAKKQLQQKYVDNFLQGITQHDGEINRKAALTVRFKKTYTIIGNEVFWNAVTEAAPSDIRLLISNIQSGK